MCVFCKISERRSTEVIVLENDVLYVVVTLHQKDSNLGAVMIVPKSHFRDIYETPTDVLSEVIKISKKCAKAMKLAFRCDGITILQNNEPAGGQDVFHYHMHVIPRFKDDRFFETKSKISSIEERIRLGNIIGKELKSEI